MEYQRVGRGGAGNVYYPQDVERISKETGQVVFFSRYFYHRIALTNFSRMSISPPMMMMEGSMI